MKIEMRAQSPKKCFSGYFHPIEGAGGLKTASFFRMTIFLIVLVRQLLTAHPLE
ncbi:MAG: hypothetical protein LE169_03210 [Endomicrobium sp.]|nr:hypothetical protein [Endomicrobium sp.]